MSGPKRDQRLDAALEELAHWAQTDPGPLPADVYQQVIVALDGASSTALIGLARLSVEILRIFKDRKYVEDRLQ